MRRNSSHFVSTPVSRSESYINPLYKLVEEKPLEIHKNEPQKEHQQKEYEEYNPQQIVRESEQNIPPSFSTTSLPTYLDQYMHQDNFADYLADLRKQHSHQLSDLEHQYYNYAQSESGEPNGEYEQEFQNFLQHEYHQLREEDEEYTPNFEEAYLRSRLGYFPPQDDENYDAEVNYYNETPEVPAQEKFKPKITIPKPFSFEKRYQQVPKKAKTGSSATPSKKFFYAKPVPTSVKIPKYEIMKIEDENRKQYFRRRWEEIQKHAKIRLEQKKQEEQMRKEKEDAPPPIPKFKANPIPVEVYEPIYAEMVEKERYRKQKIKERAELLLQESAPVITNHLEETDRGTGRSRKEINKIYILAGKVEVKYTPDFRPKVNHHVPNFVELQARFELQLLQKKSAFRNTTAKEFDLKTNQIASRKEKVIEDIHRDESQGKERRWPYQGTRGRVISNTPVFTVEVPNTKTTLAYELKKKAAQSSINSRKNQEQQEKEAKRRLNEKQKDMKKAIVSKIRPPTKTKEEILKEKKKEFQQRDKEYKISLEQTLKKLEQERPMLFERYKDDKARKNAQTEADKLLKKAGIKTNISNLKKKGNLDPDVAALTAVKMPSKKSDSDSDSSDSDSYSNQFESESSSDSG